MWCKPRALQCRHQGLAVYLRFQYIDGNEDCAEYRAEEEDPTITPTTICYQPNERQEQRIPKSCFSHCAHGWMLKRNPHRGNVRTENEQSNYGEQAYCFLSFATQRKQRSHCPAENCRQGKEPKFIPCYHFLPANMLNAPASIMKIPT